MPEAEEARASYLNRPATPMTLSATLRTAYDAARRRFSRRISGAKIGICVDEVELGDLAALRSLEYRGRLPLVRTFNHGDPASAERILTLADEGFPLLVTIPFGKGLGPVVPGMTIQIDHEPDAQSPAVSPEQYGQTFRSTMQFMRKRLPSSIPIVTAGFSPTASVEWVARALEAGAGDADAVCFNIASFDMDLDTEYVGRLAVLQAAMEYAACEKPLWMTGVGFTAASLTGHGNSMRALLALPELRMLQRVYLGPLATKEAAEVPFGLCANDASRSPRPSFVEIRKAVRRP